VGLCEGTAIRIEGNTASLRGTSFCRIFRKGQPAVDRQAGSDLSDLL
jgi:hypothetical protein